MPPAARPLLRDLGLLDGFLAAAHPVSGTYAARGQAQLHGRSRLFDRTGTADTSTGSASTPSCAGPPSQPVPSRCGQRRCAGRPTPDRP
ncbi:hypothetical protein ACFC6L_29005 [Kitasatospora phosalacinea]|uniref:hypothetical protein n=1 Tax=Kitasatospora phosalacinea TaxID=2065 RepID=UPI0035D9E51E